MFGRKRKEVVSIEILAGRCIGCGRCASRCRRKVLTMAVMDQRDVASIHSFESCVGCGKCISVCRMDAIDLVVRDLK